MLIRCIRPPMAPFSVSKKSSFLIRRAIMSWVDKAIYNCRDRLTDGTGSDNVVSTFEFNKIYDIA